MNRVHGFLLVTAALLSLTACQRESSSGAARPEMAEPAYASRRSMTMDAVADQKARNPYLAFEHYFSIRLPEGRIRERFQAAVDQCNEEGFHGCTLLEASLNEDRDRISGTLRMRIQTSGVDPLISTASEGGEVASQTSRAEDLTEAVSDTDKRLEMLLAYRERLEALETRAAEDIEALIQVNSELARVQSDIEYAQANRDNLQRRLDLDLLNINFYARSEDSFFAPIIRALENFAYNLSAGVSGIITTIAVGLPWLLGLLLAFVTARRLWRRRRKPRL